MVPWLSWMLGVDVTRALAEGILSIAYALLLLLLLVTIKLMFLSYPDPCEAFIYLVATS